MATEKQIEYVVNALENSHIDEFLGHLNGAKEGVGFVLKILNESGSPLTAGDISEKMSVSTARVAVLLQKMLKKDLIVKKAYEKDGRVTIVELTAHGKDVALSMQSEMNKHVSAVIDGVGMEKIMVFIALASEIEEVARTNIDVSEI